MVSVLGSVVMQRPGMGWSSPDSGSGLQKETLRDCNLREKAKQITLNGGRRVAMSSYKGQEYRVREETGWV